MQNSNNGSQSGHDDGDESLKEGKTEQGSPNNNNGQNEASQDDFDNRYVIRLRGLPWTAREAEIRNFFKDEKISEVHIIYLNDGRASGEAIVEFATLKDYNSASSKNRCNMGHRYIEILKSSGKELDSVVGRKSRTPQIPKSQFIVRMRGLPFSAAEADVYNFFEEIHPTGVHLIKDDFGRPSGEGFVEFATESDALNALSKHRKHMGTRYIELFRSTSDDLMKALGLQPRPYHLQGKTSYLKSTCILMRGLPYSCTEADITKFFQEIDVTPVRIHRKADGADAYVEFYSVPDADKAMTRHKGYIGKRYIELFRVTYEDMARTVGLPLNQPYISTAPDTMNYQSMYSPLNYPFRYDPNTLNMTTLTANVINTQSKRNK